MQRRTSRDLDGLLTAPLTLNRPALMGVTIAVCKNEGLRRTPSSGIAPQSLRALDLGTGVQLALSSISILSLMACKIEGLWRTPIMGITPRSLWALGLRAGVQLAGSTNSPRLLASAERQSSAEQTSLLLPRLASPLALLPV